MVVNYADFVVGLRWNINFPRSSSLDVCFAPNRGKRI